MRQLSILCLFVFFASCRSETAQRALEVSTQVEIKLPANAIYGSLTSFEGLHAAVPDVFMEEQIIDQDGSLLRRLELNDQTTFLEEFVKKDDDLMQIAYRCIKTTLPVENLRHYLEVSDKDGSQCKLRWVSQMKVQNQHREAVKEKLKGIQESYLFSLELLGEEMDELLNDLDF